MPNRVIRESLLDSPRYAGLTLEARLLFLHLLLLADDFGCISISETFLRRRAFYDTPNGQKIAKLLHELVDVDLIRTYEHERATYAFIPRFRQRLQRKTLKHPQPPETLYADDEHAMDLFNEYNGKRKTPTVSQRLDNSSTTVAQHTKRREEKRREEEGKPAAVTVPRDWWRTDDGIMQKLTDLGLKPLPGETYYAIKQRIFAHLEAVKNT